MKRYGDTKTNLTLSDKAQDFYSGCDPLNIYEHSNGTYSVTGLFCGEDMTADEVNEMLEQLADEAAELEREWADE